jgi:hypothetical protein
MDADQIARLVMARCGDALDEATTADLSARLEGQVVPIATFDAVAEILAAFEERLVQLETRLDAAPRRAPLRFGNGAGDFDEDGVTSGAHGVRRVRVERRRN